MKKLKINSEITFYEKKYIVIEKDSLNVILLSVGDNKILNIGFQELVSNSTFDDGEDINEYKGLGVYKSVLSSLDEKKREIVTKRFEIIRPILALEEVKSNGWDSQEFCKEYLKPFIKENEIIKKLTQKAIIERISDKYSISIPTIKRYLKSFREVEENNTGFGQEGLIPKSGSGFNYRQDNKIIEICFKKSKEIMFTINCRLDAVYIPIINDAIKEVYLTKMKNSKKAVWDYINIKCIKLDIDTPSEITIYKMLSRIDDRVKNIAREGKKVAEAYDDIYRGFTNNEAFYPLHIVAIDHTPVDIELIDENTGYVLGKPWLTLGIDLFSRCVWCMYLSFEPPSNNRTRKALQHGIFFKFVKEKYQIESEWDVFGFPDHILVDNGSDFRSYEMKRIVNEIMRSDIMHRPVREPRYGGVIERYFGTVDTQLIHRLKGTTKINPYVLGDYKPEEEAILTLDDVKELLTRYIVEEYQ